MSLLDLPVPGPVDAAVHEHEWRLVSIEYEDSRECRCFECAECGANRFA
jgi:hypothetical protein